MSVTVGTATRRALVMSCGVTRRQLVLWALLGSLVGCSRCFVASRESREVQDSDVVVKR